MQKEFGVVASLGSLRRFRRCVIKELTAAAMIEAEESVEGVNGTKATLAGVSLFLIKKYATQPSG